jgi:hypothetical protein
MKKIKLLLALLFIYTCSFCQTFTCEKSSIQYGIPIAIGSMQWFEIGDTSEITSDTRIEIYILHFSVSTMSIDFEDIILNQYLISYLDTSNISDSGKIKVYFNIPVYYPYNNFLVYINSNPTFGISSSFLNGTSIPELTTTSETKYTFTNFLGQLTTELKGLLIRSDKRLIFFE